jgi:hypothetical protein
MAEFNWQNEDEDEWPVNIEEIEDSDQQRPSWRVPLIIIVILTLTAVGLYFFFNHRAEEARKVIKADVRSTHELVMAAAEDGDLELFKSFLSGVSGRWLELQLEAVKGGNFDEAPLLGLRLEDRPDRVDEITLTPTLDEATVIYTRWYQNEDGNEYLLQHEVIYRRGADRWLLAPPSAEFWGREATIWEGPLILVYPERDEAQATRLAADLASSLSEVCAHLPGASCPEAWELTVTFSADLEHLLYPSLIESLTLTLPTPSLLGRPLDNDGYQALLQSYQTLLLQEAPLRLARFLEERPEFAPPVIEADNLANISDSEMTFSCRVESDDRSFLHLFRYNPAQAHWQVMFSRTYMGEDNGFVTAFPGGEPVIIQEYFPEELLTSRLSLWRNGETYLIDEQTTNFESALTAVLYPVNTDPSKQFISFASASEEDPQWLLLDSASCVAGQGCGALKSILNLPLWSPDGSQTLMTDQVSMDDILEPGYQGLYRADSLGQDPVRFGEGIAPFWLTDSTYGYIRLNDEEGVEVVLADSADDEPRVWFKTADLIPLVPEERNSEQMSIWGVVVNPADPDMVFIMATSGRSLSEGPYDYFIIQGTGSEPQIEWLVSSEIRAVSPYSLFSPDGRYLVLSQRSQTIHFRDLETGQILPYDNSLGFFSGWTPAGRYYAQRTDETLTLTSLENQAQIRVRYDFSTCTEIQWPVHPSVPESAQ